MRHMRSLVLRSVTMPSEGVTVMHYMSNDAHRSLTLSTTIKRIGDLYLQVVEAQYNGRPVHASTAFALLGQDLVYAP